MFLEQTKTSILKSSKYLFYFSGFTDFFRCIMITKRNCKKEKKLTLGSGGPPPS
jgi:hypothetical protein